MRADPERVAQIIGVKKKTTTHTRGDATERGKLLLERNCDSFMYIAIRCVAYAAMSLLHNEFEAAGFFFLLLEKCKTAPSFGQNRNCRGH